MQEIYPRLYLVHPADKTETGQPYSYLIARPEGNALIVNLKGGGDLTPALPAITAMGGAAIILLTDKTAAGPGLKPLADALGARVRCAAPDADSVSALGVTVDAPFPVEDGPLYDDIAVVAAPGYTPGTVCFKISSDMSEYLFTGELIYPSGDDGWGTVERAEDGDALIDSLEKLQELEFHVLVGASARSTEVPFFDAHPGKIWKMFEAAKEAAEDL